MSARAAAAALLGLAARILPRELRRDWRAEWEAELAEVVRRGDRSPVVFCLGAVRHAVWLRGRTWTLAGVRDDLGQALRGLARSPGFVVAAALTVGLGIGANAVVFSLLNGLVLRAPAGIAEPERLVQIGRGDRPEDFDAWSYPYVDDLRAATGDVFTGLAAWSDARGILGAGADARAIAVQLVSGGYFDVLGVRPAAGRLLAPSDAPAPAATPVVVLSYALWQSAFAGDPSVVGRDIVLEGRSWRVIGVAQAGFAGADPLRPAPGAWVPVTMQGALTDRPDAVLEQRTNSWLWIFARLAPGVDRARADAAVRAAHERIARARPDAPAEGILVAAGIGARPADRAAVLRLGAILLATVLVVLLIACANVAGLALARAATRRGEMALRSALGAGRGRLVRQLLLESLGIGLVGALVAAGLTFALSGVLPLAVPVPVAVDFHPDGRVLAFTAAVTLVAVLVFGTAPALAAARTEPLRALRGSGVGRGGGASMGRLRRALVVLQVALAFVLLAGATLLVRSLRHAGDADTGFRTHDVVAITVEAGRSLGADPAARASLRSRVERRLGAVPGIDAVGSATVLPIAEAQPNRTPFPPGALPSLRDGPPPAPVYVNTVDGGYFEALGLAPIAGRSFDETLDAPDGAPAIMVNRRFVERFFPDADPVGAAVAWAGDGVAPVIVGVAPDAAVRSLGERPPAVLYFAAAQRAPAAFHLLVRTRRTDDAALRRDLADAIADVDARIPVLRIDRLDRLVGGSLAETRLTAATATAAGGLALLLAVIGLHGVIACAVTDRRREFGIRFALGARRGDVLRLVLRQAALLAGLGVALGLALALASLRVLEGLLFGLRPGDPVTLAAIALTLAGVTLAASALPALRAARTDPTRSLEGA